MVNPDLINGCFEFGMSLFCAMSVRRLLRDKRVAGFHPLTVAFPTAWGFWNLFYYPSLHQWWSFAGGLGVVIANSIWLMLIVYFNRASKT